MRSLSVHLTDLCNSRCSFCVVGSPHYVADTIDVDLVKRFLNAHANDGYQVVNLHGGEATIHPQFFDILELIKSLGFAEVHLQTNGIRMAEAQFACRLYEYGVSLFIVSLHGHDASTHDTQTGTPGGFAKTLRGIRNVRELGASIRTNTVVSLQNVGHLLDITELTCELGVDHLNFSNLHPVGSATFAFDRVVPRVGRIISSLAPAIDAALKRGKRVTLEGFPYCTILPYEHLHLHEERREIRMLIRGSIIDDYDTFMNRTCRVLGPQCATCALAEKCGGVYPEYTERIGWEEFYAC